jgi:hypothetical protein
MKKKFYETPEAELFTVRFEVNIMSPAYGQKNKAGLQFEEELINGYDEDF